MNQARLHLRRNGATHLSRALFVALLAAILVGRADFPSATAPQQPTPSPLAALRGAQPFATVLCKFADVATEPDAVVYFERLLGSAYPGLDHYWREVSYNAVSLAGSRVMGWHELPHAQAYYLTGRPHLPVPTLESPVDLRRLAEDCIAAAGAALEPTRYVGLNLVFNADLDRPRGSELCLELASGSTCYRTTWLWPGWYHNQSIWAHEMGHAFGLQHSAVGSGNGYGNLWDVMSVDGPCNSETGYGRIGQHPIAHQKEFLGWIPAGRIFVAEPDSQATITLEQTALPGPGGYLLAQIPIRSDAARAPDRALAGLRPNQFAGAGAGRHYYTVEARRRAGYDAALPGDAVIIHEVNLDGDPQVRPISQTRRNAGHPGETTGSAGRWAPGQLFHDSENGIAISIARATPTGFVVTIFTQPPPALLASDATILTEGGAAAPPEAFAAVQRSGGESRPVIAADRRGAFAVWSADQAEAGDGLTPTRSSRTDIYFAGQSIGGVWSERERINDDSRDSRSQPAIAVDRRGNTYAAWVDYRDGDAAIYAATRPLGGAWGKNVRLDGGSTQGYTELGIIVDWEDNAHVIWEGLDRCGANEVIVGRDE